MEIKFENGSKIETIEPKSKDYKRGNAFPICFLEDCFKGEKMKFYNMCEGTVYSTLGQYIGALTKELDKLSGRQENNYMKHYVVINDLSLSKKCIPIRVPGGTVGGIYIDNDMMICSIDIDTNYVVKTYPDNVNEHMKKFVGEKIEY